MNTERHISYKGEKVKLSKTEFDVYMLDKIQGAIEEIKENKSKEINITLEFQELLNIRRLLILGGLQSELLRDNLIEQMEYGESLNKLY